MVVWEEPNACRNNVQTIKKLLSGDPVVVSVKYKGKQQIKRTPVLVSTNHKEWGMNGLKAVDEEALQQRCVTFEFNQPWDKKKGAMTSIGLYTFIYS